MTNSRDHRVSYALMAIETARADLKGASIASRTLASRLWSLAEVVCGLTAAMYYLDEYDAYDARAKR